MAVCDETRRGRRRSTITPCLRAAKHHAFPDYLHIPPPAICCICGSSLGTFPWRIVPGRTAAAAGNADRQAYRTLGLPSMVAGGAGRLCYRCGKEETILHEIIDLRTVEGRGDLLRLCAHHAQRTFTPLAAAWPHQHHTWAPAGLPSGTADGRRAGGLGGEGRSATRLR